MITYGHEKYIGKAIQGVLMQKCDFYFELIIVNDFSPDKTDVVVQDFLKNHQRGSLIKYIKHNKNIGMMANFIFALKQAQHKYIAFCEGDDYWTDPLKLQKQVDFLENNSEYGLVYTDYDKLNHRTGIIEYNVFENNQKVIQNTFDYFLMNAPFLATCTWLLRKDLIDVKELIYKIGDLTVLLGISSKTKVKYSNESTACYRVLENSASHFTSIEKLFEFNREVLEIRNYYALKKGYPNRTLDLLYYQFIVNNYNFVIWMEDKVEIKSFNNFLMKYDKTEMIFKIKVLMSYSLVGRFILKYRIKKLNAK